MDETTPAPLNTDSIVFPWDTPKHCAHNTRVLCDLAGLTLEQKNILCACVFQESRFDTQAEHKNLNADGSVSSTDWGIIQCNDFFHIAPHGTPFASVQSVLSDPNADVHWMIQCYKAGNLGWWSSFKTGAYRQWLVPNSPMWALFTP